MTGLIAGTDVYDAASMRAGDAATIAAGTPGAVLMERAGAAVAAVVRDRFPHAHRVAVVCGGGANGGDGIVAARHLRAAGVDAVCTVIASRPYAGDAALACDEAVRAGVPISRVGAIGAGLEGVDLVIDALLGTGAVGAPRGAVAAAIDAIGLAGVPVVAVDVPSGVDASTGETPGAVVRADATVTFHALKVGHLVMPGRAHVGAVVVADIGIVAGAGGSPARLVGTAAIEARVGRSRVGSKYDAGSVVVVGGSTGMTGAIALCARAALRGGAGIVVAAVPASLNAVLEVKLTEPMTLPCPDDDGALLPAALAAIVTRTARAGCVVVGPGIGRDPRTAALVVALAAAVEAPLLVDADALHAIPLELLAARPGPTIVTPHAGEAAALLGLDRAAVEASRLDAARRIASVGRTVCVLKGPDTLVVAPAGTLAIRDGDDPGIATAGAGDVLAGTIAALVAVGNRPFQAAAIGAAAHLAAAGRARIAAPGRAIIASDLVELLELG
jgi:NAD(P)H-hydrate epimerase